MKFDFFTLGGNIFWEDVFFYQKWRIQRNCITGRYRLLDSWDIRRASGNFEVCQKAFASYIKIYEMTKQPSRLIVLLHGYLDNKNIFKRLWRKLALTNSTVVALNYPSLFRNTLASAHQLLFFLNHMEDINEVSFVTKGLGNQVLQKALNLPLELQTYRQNMRIGNIVELNPVIKASFICELLMRFKFFRFICGPALADMTEKSVKKLPDLSSKINYIQLFSESKTDRLWFKLLSYCKFPVEEQTHRRKNAIFIRGKAFKTLADEEILTRIVKFIRTGKI